MSSAAIVLGVPVTPMTMPAPAWLVLSALRLPFRHKPEGADSTGDIRARAHRFGNIKPRRRQIGRSGLALSGHETRTSDVVECRNR